MAVSIKLRVVAAGAQEENAKNRQSSWLSLQFKIQITCILLFQLHCRSYDNILALLTNNLLVKNKIKQSKIDLSAFGTISNLQKGSFFGCKTDRQDRHFIYLVTSLFVSVQFQDPNEHKVSTKLWIRIYHYQLKLAISLFWVIYL